MKISVLQNRQYLCEALPDGPDARESFLHRQQQALEEVFLLAEEAARNGARILVTTETVNRLAAPADPRMGPGMPPEPLDGNLVRRFGRIAGKYGAYLIAGLLTEQDGRPYNTAVLLGPDGRLFGYYNKTHIPAGEAVTPGGRLPVFDTDCGRIGILICWDMQFPEAARALSLSGADLICCPTWGWENLYGLCRAYENGVTIAAANALPAHGEMWPWCDPSCIVDPMGRVAACGARDRTGIITADLDLRREPPLQYFAERVTSIRSMRQLRTMQRRPELYGGLTEKTPPLLQRYESEKK